MLGQAEKKRVEARVEYRRFLWALGELPLEPGESLTVLGHDWQVDQVPWLRLQRNGDPATLHLYFIGPNPRVGWKGGEWPARSLQTTTRHIGLRQAVAAEVLAGMRQTIEDDRLALALTRTREEAQQAAEAEARATLGFGFSPDRETAQREKGQSPFSRLDVRRTPSGALTFTVQVEGLYALSAPQVLRLKALLDELRRPSALTDPEGHREHRAAETLQQRKEVP